MEKLTGAIKTVAGVQFSCWHVGINRYEHRSPVGTIRRNYRLTGFYATTPKGFMLKTGQRPKVFRRFETAAQALIIATTG